MQKNVVKCSDCGIELDINKLKSRNKYPNHNDYFCDDCLDECKVCRDKFADYIGDGICVSCA